MLLGSIDTVLSVAVECIRARNRRSVYMCEGLIQPAVRVLFERRPRLGIPEPTGSVLSTGYRLLLSHPGELRHNTGARFIVFLHASCHGSRSSCEAYSRQEFGVRFYLLLILPYCIEGSKVLDCLLQCRDTIKRTLYYLK